MKKFLIASIFLLLIFFGLFFVLNQRETKGDPKPAVAQKQVQRSGTIELGDSSFENNVLTIDSITVSHTPAWLVVYAQTNGRPGKKITELYLEATNTEQISLPLSLENDAQAVYLLLHEDTAELGTFDFLLHDRPFTDMQAVQVAL